MGGWEAGREGGHSSRDTYQLCTTHVAERSWLSVSHCSTCLSVRLSEMGAWCYIAVLYKYNDVKRNTHVVMLLCSIYMLQVDVSICHTLLANDTVSFTMTT